MPLTDQQITECYERYLRELDRYTKMAELTYEKCLEIVQKKLTVRATVQRRAKNPKSFVEKLRKPENKRSTAPLMKYLQKLAISQECASQHTLNPTACLWSKS